METGIEIITAERKRQFEVEGYSVMQDFYRNSKGELLESFSSGTAVIVGPVKNIEYKG